VPLIDIHDSSSTAAQSTADCGVHATANVFKGMSKTEIKIIIAARNILFSFAPIVNGILLPSHKTGFIYFLSLLSLKFLTCVIISTKQLLVKSNSSLTRLN
jgi:hypothetical protein